MMHLEKKDNCWIEKDKKIMNRTNCSLSVIVPVYNAESTLRLCMESILNQSYKDFEVILVDDGSTDNSPGICDAYAQNDSRVTAIHIKNSGTFQARKRGVEKARGKVLSFSDADDWLEENAFEIAMVFFDKYTPDIVAYAYDRGKGKVEKHLYKEGLYHRERIQNEIIPGMMYDSACGDRRLNPSLCCKLIKKALYTKVTESVEDRITLGEDAIVTYPAVCLAESIFICNKVLYHYRINDASCTHTYPLERITEVKAFQDNIIRLFDEMGMLTQTNYQIENYVRTFLAMMVRNWYGIELTSVLFAFPYNFISRGDKVMIYGAGNVGKSYVNELKLTNYAEIVGWVDKKYDSIKEYHGVHVTAPEQLTEKEFDLLLVAILDETAARAVIANLVDMGIPEDKILWKKPLCVYMLC